MWFSNSMYTTVIWGYCENKVDSWGLDPVDSVGLGVAQPFYQAPHELVSQLVCRPPTGFEARPIGQKPVPTHLPFSIYNIGRIPVKQVLR